MAAISRHLVQCTSVSLRRKHLQVATFKGVYGGASNATVNNALLNNTGKKFREPPSELTIVTDTLAARGIYAKGSKYYLDLTVV
jgi:hypothetical protein